MSMLQCLGELWNKRKNKVMTVIQFLANPVSRKCFVHLDFAISISSWSYCVFREQMYSSRLRNGQLVYLRRLNVVEIRVLDVTKKWRVGFSRSKLSNTQGRCVAKSDFLCWNILLNFFVVCLMKILHKYHNIY